MKNFTISQVTQDPTGRHFIHAVAEDGDVFTLNTAEKEDFEAGHVVEVELDNLSTYETQKPVEAPAADEQAPVVVVEPEPLPIAESSSQVEQEKVSDSSSDVAKAAE